MRYGKNDNDQYPLNGPASLCRQAPSLKPATVSLLKKIHLSQMVKSYVWLWNMLKLLDIWPFRGSFNIVACGLLPSFGAFLKVGYPRIIQYQPLLAINKPTVFWAPLYWETPLLPHHQPLTVVMFQRSSMVETPKTGCKPPNYAGLGYQTASTCECYMCV